MSGIIGQSPDMRSGVVGAWPSGIILQAVRGQSTTSGSIVGTTGIYGEMLTFDVTAKKANPSYTIIYSFTGQNTYTWMSCGLRITMTSETGGSNNTVATTADWKNPSSGAVLTVTGMAIITTNASAGDTLTLALDLYHNSGVSTTTYWWTPSMIAMEY